MAPTAGAGVDGRRLPGRQRGPGREGEAAQVRVPHPPAAEADGLSRAEVADLDELRVGLADVVADQVRVGPDPQRHVLAGAAAAVVGVPEVLALQRRLLLQAVVRGVEGALVEGRQPEGVAFADQHRPDVAPGAALADGDRAPQAALVVDQAGPARGQAHAAPGAADDLLEPRGGLEPVALAAALRGMRAVPGQLHRLHGDEAHLPHAAVDADVHRVPVVDGDHLPAPRPRGRGGRGGSGNRGGEQEREEQTCHKFAAGLAFPPRPEAILNSVEYAFPSSGLTSRHHT